MTNSEKAAYIRGLMEGMDLDPNAKETKLFNAIVDLLDDLSLSVEEMEDAYDELSGQVDEIDEDLGELEEEFYDIDEDDDDDDDDAWEDECYYEVTCPIIFGSYKPVKNGRVVLRLSFFFSHG